MLEQIQINLDNNEYLTDDIKNNIYSLVVIFNKKFPEIKLRNLSEKLKTLKIETISKFAQKDVIKYLPKDNLITINLTEADGEHDFKHLLMFVLLQIITSNGNNFGFDVDNKYEALNLGYTEILTNNLVGNESENLYFTKQAIHANVIGDIVGLDVMFNAYFFNKVSLILDVIEESGGL